MSLTECRANRLWTEVGATRRKDLTLQRVRQNTCFDRRVSHSTRSKD